MTTRSRSTHHRFDSTYMVDFTNQSTDRIRETGTTVVPEEMRRLVEAIARAFAVGDAQELARNSDLLGRNIAYMNTAMWELTNRPLNP